MKLSELAKAAALLEERDRILSDIEGFAVGHDAEDFTVIIGGLEDGYEKSGLTGEPWVVRMAETLRRTLDEQLAEIDIRLREAGVTEFDN